MLGALALALGWRPRLAGLAPALLLGLAGTAAFVALGLLLAGTLRSEAVLAVANLVWVLLAAGGAVLVPAAEGSGWERIAHALPSGALGSGLRSALQRRAARRRRARRCSWPGRPAARWPPSACSTGTDPRLGRSASGTDEKSPGARCIRGRPGAERVVTAHPSPGDHPMRSLRALAVAGALAAAVGTGVALAAPSSAAGTSQVSVLHGVPGLTVDVYANGQKLLTNFKPGTLTDPVALPEGTYDLKVFPAGKGPDGTPAIEAKGVKVPAGANITVVAHLTADGKPTLTPYVNDVSTIKPGQARITVRHDAAAPAVDVRAGGTPVFKNLTNPNEAKADIARRHRSRRTSSSPAPPPSRSARPT